jgi:predicted acylesterase/phospholipase RssA
MNRSIARLASVPPSISFSGAGFLGCYHIGVAQALKDKGLLTVGPESTQTLLGSSAGALVSAGVLCGVTTADAMTLTKEIAQDASDQGVLNALTPNYSLIDSVRPRLLEKLRSIVPNGNDCDAYIKSKVNATAGWWTRCDLLLLQELEHNKGRASERVWGKLS